LSQIFVFNGLLTQSGEIRVPDLWGVPMILNAIAEKLTRQSKDDFKGGISRHGSFFRPLPGTCAIR
jgi:hypothetical protein